MHWGSVVLPSVFLKILRTSNPSMLGRQRGRKAVLNRVL